MQDKQEREAGRAAGDDTARRHGGTAVGRHILSRTISIAIPPELVPDSGAGEWVDGVWGAGGSQVARFQTQTTPGPANVPMLEQRYSCVPVSTFSTRAAFACLDLEPVFRPLLCITCRTARTTQHTQHTC